MDITSEIQKILEHFTEAIPLFASTFIAYLTVSILGILLISFYKKKEEETSPVRMLFISQIFATLFLLLVFSIVQFRFLSIHTLFLIPLTIWYFKEKPRLKFNAQFFHQNLLKCTPVFVLSVLFLFSIELIQLVKYDFFDPSIVKNWGDYSYYAALSKSYLINHHEYNYLTLPFFESAAKYGLYHYSDIEINSILNLTFTQHSALYNYAYVFIPCMCMIFLNGLVSLINSIHLTIQKTVLIYLVLLCMLLSVLFNFHIHKSYLSFSVLILLFVKEINSTQFFCLLAVSLILNPIVSICAPLLFYYHLHTGTNNTVVSAEKLKWYINIGAILICTLLVTLAYQNHQSSYALITMSEFIQYEKTEILYPLISSMVVALLLFTTEMKKHLHFIVICLILLVCTATIPYTGIIHNYESWQLHQTLKNFIFILSIVFFINLISTYWLNDSRIILRNLVFAGLLLVTSVLSVKDFIELYDYFRQFYFSCNKSELLKTESILKNNECIGTYNLYDNAEPRLEFFTQSSSSTYELYFSSFFNEKQVWFTNINMHQRYDSLQPGLKLNWEKSLYYQYLLKNKELEKEDAALDFLHQYRIKHIVANCETDLLPKWLSSRLVFEQQFTIDNKAYTLYEIK
jgi:hypothetical protein